MRSETKIYSCCGSEVYIETWEYNGGCPECGNARGMPADVVDKKRCLY